MSAANWRHTERSGGGIDRAEPFPVAPWAAHPDAPLDRDLLAELLSTLRDDVSGWHDIAASNRNGSGYAEARLEGAIAALRVAERLTRRAAHRAQLEAGQQ